MAIVGLKCSSDDDGFSVFINAPPNLKFDNEGGFWPVHR